MVLHKVFFDTFLKSSSLKKKGVLPGMGASFDDVNSLAAVPGRRKKSCAKGRKKTCQPLNLPVVCF